MVARGKGWKEVSVITKGQHKESLGVGTVQYLDVVVDSWTYTGDNAVQNFTHTLSTSKTWGT